MKLAIRYKVALIRAQYWMAKLKMNEDEVLIAALMQIKRMHIFALVVIIRVSTTWGLPPTIGSSTILLLLWKFLFVSSYLLLILWLRIFVSRTSFLITVPADNVEISICFVANMPLACCAKAMVSINSLNQNCLNLLSIFLMSLSVKGFCLSLLQEKNKQLCQTFEHINHSLIR